MVGPTTIRCYSPRMKGVRGAVVQEPAKRERVNSARSAPLRQQMLRFLDFVLGVRRTPSLRSFLWEGFALGAYAVMAWVAHPGDLSAIFALLAGVSLGNLGRLYVAKNATRAAAVGGAEPSPMGGNMIEPAEGERADERR